MIKIAHAWFPEKFVHRLIALILGATLLSVAVFALYSCSGTGREKQKKSIPETTVAIDSMLKDFGEIPQYSTAEAVFSINNTGKNDLVLSEVNTDCHCTIASWDSLPVPPGQSAKVKVNFDTKAFGFFQQTVNVTLNTKEKIISCLIRGKVMHSKEN
jgi:Protein of unknown function (DUF1573)